MNLSRSSQSKRLKAKLLLTTMALLFSLSSFFVAIPTAGAAGISMSKASYRLGESLIVSGSGFGAGEKIALWLTGPSGTAYDAEYLNANLNGTFESFPVGGGNTTANNIYVQSGPGTWYLTAKGLTSGATAITNFAIRTPTLTAQGVTVGNVLLIFFVGGDWFPGEKVILWASGGDGQAVTGGYTYADGNGKIPDVTVSALQFGYTGTAGNFALTAQGNSSGWRAISTFTATKAA